MREVMGACVYVCVYVCECACVYRSDEEGILDWLMSPV